MFLKKIHNFSINNRNSIQKSNSCGCFHCLNIFSPGLIEDWCDLDQEGVAQTALCPICGIDSILGDFDVELTPDLLKQMRSFWFG